MTEPVFCDAIIGVNRSLNMRIAFQLQKLKRKHEELARAVEKAQKAPGFDTFQIINWKKQKLRIKEEIHKLSS